MQTNSEEKKNKNKCSCQRVILSLLERGSESERGGKGGTCSERQNLGGGKLLTKLYLFVKNHNVSTF